MSGRVVHFEVPFDDAERARGFYGEVFGWDLREMPEMAYTMVSTGPVGDQGMPAEPGYINGGMMQRNDVADRPVLTLDVEDIDATLAAVEERGGSTVMGRNPVGEMGFTAYFKDCEGNLMGLWQNA